MTTYRMTRKRRQALIDHLARDLAVGYLDSALRATARGEVAKSFSLWTNCKALLPADWFTQATRRAGEGLH